ncbi:MAG: molybdopterin cofactor-binding domain-containing protein [Armatimonadota bacterium]
MNEETADELSLEPERYELQSELAERWRQAKQEFFDVGGDGIIVVYGLEEVSARTESEGRRGGPGRSLPQEIGVWLQVRDDGQVIGYTGKVEFGQNIRTSLIHIIADELPVPPDSIQLVMGDTDLSPFDGGTTGSRSTPVVAPQMRRVAAAARELLRDLAVRQGLSVLATDGTWTASVLANLTRGQRLFKCVGEDVVTKPPAEWRSAEQPTNTLSRRALVTGQHHYTSDLKRPGMRYGKVLRAPSRNARRTALDTSAAAAMPGVTVVHDEDFIGVVATDDLTAARALAAIQANWEPLDGQPSTNEIFDYLLQHPGEIPVNGTPVPYTEGVIAEGLAAAEQVLESRYTVAYIAHAPLEPRAAVAEITGKDESQTLTVWTGTQRPFGVRAELALALGMTEDRIRVIVPDTGSGYGGKHIGDAAIETARLARGAGGAVKLVWTREEEFTHAYFRPAGVIDIHSGIDANGTLTAWEHHNYNSGSSAIRTLYRVPHQHIEFHSAQSPLRQGSYRALAATANHFARETHMDELAHIAQSDPLAFRLQRLDDTRLRDVLEAAAERFGWGTATPSPGHGFGIAGGHEKGSYVATCAEVAVDPENGKVTVVRAVTAFECGAIHHADNVRNQVDGAVLMGLGGALFEQVEFENGQIQNPCFSQYRVPRFSDVPILETVLLDRKHLPSVGAGETPIVAIAPAIGNAIFAATGVRLRSLPLAPHGVR